MKTYLLLVLLTILISGKLHSATCTAIGNGDWSNGSTWSCSRAPASNDNIVIPAGKKVTLDIVTPTYSGMVITINGELEFQGGKKINMASDGVINVSSSGSLTGGNGGSKIVIGGATVWSGPGPSYGPLSFGGGVLPIQLKSFTALAHGRNINIKWSTASEKNNDHFIVEKSENGIDFKSVTKVQGAGNSTSDKEYSWIDRNPIEGNSYYRLSQVDNDGKRQSFEVIAVHYTPTSFAGCILKVYPNPCSSDCTINLAECDEKDAQEIHIELLDAKGNSIISRIPERDTRGSFSFSVDSKNNLAPGIYIVRAVSQKEKYVQRLIVK